MLLSDLNIIHMLFEQTRFAALVNVTIGDKLYSVKQSNNTHINSRSLIFINQATGKKEICIWKNADEYTDEFFTEQAKITDGSVVRYRSLAIVDCHSRFGDLKAVFSPQFENHQSCSTRFQPDMSYPDTNPYPNFAPFNQRNPGFIQHPDFKQNPFDPNPVPFGPWPTQRTQPLYADRTYANNLVNTAPINAIDVKRGMLLHYFGSEFMIKTAHQINSKLNDFVNYGRNSQNRLQTEVTIDIEWLVHTDEKQQALVACLADVLTQNLVTTGFTVVSSNPTPNQLILNIAI